MPLSTTGRYGVRMMLDLALNHETGHILMKDIAKRQGISERYLEQLVLPIKAAGLLKTLRCANG